MLIEQEVVRRRLLLIKLTHPVEAALTSALLETLRYEKSVHRDPNQLRVMVFTLGKKLATEGKIGLISWNAWLLQFVKDGALSEEQAADFKRQAEDIRRFTQVRSDILVTTFFMDGTPIALPRLL